MGIGGWFSSEPALTGVDLSPLQFAPRSRLAERTCDPLFSAANWFSEATHSGGRSIASGNSWGLVVCFGESGARPDPNAVARVISIARTSRPGPVDRGGTGIGGAHCLIQAMELGEETTIPEDLKCCSV